MADPASTHPPADTRPSDPASAQRQRSLIVFYVVLVAIAVVLLAVALNRPLREAMQGFFGILSPILIGAVIAYLCNPILLFFERVVFRALKHDGWRRGLSLFLTVLTALAILCLIGLAVIPQLYESLTHLVANIDVYVADLQAWVDSLDLPFELDIYDLMTPDQEGESNPLQSILDQLAPLITGGSLADRIGRLLVGLFDTFKNLLIGMFIAFYILASKEKRIAQVRKARAALLSDKIDAKVSEIVTLFDNTFGGFIHGKILDSLVVGILTFVILTIFNISDYNLLIAFIVGVCNLIPIFGALIGAVPSFFIVLISEPSGAILFLILVLLIQQLDSNIIAPKILGDNTGISSLCVIVAITVCSALWGVAGLFIGVPFFAVIIELIRRFLEKRLSAQGAPTDTTEYYPDDAVGNPEADVHYEHTGLLYLYEHSRLKPALDRFRAWLFAITPLKRKETPPSDEPSAPPPTDPPEQPPAS